LALTACALIAIAIITAAAIMYLHKKKPSKGNFTGKQGLENSYQPQTPRREPKDLGPQLPMEKQPPTN